MKLRRFAGLVLLLSMAGCAAQTQPVTTPTPPPGEAPLPTSIQWMTTSAEYAALAVQTYRVATTHVEAMARTRTAGAWAVVLDADDTVINNFPYQMGLARERTTHTAERFTAWVRTQASTPVPGAAAFLARVRALGGRIAIVTNRLAIECPDTAAVLRKHALPFDTVLCRLEGAGSGSDKNPRFEAVAAGQTDASRTPIEVVAFVGDNIMDFPGGSQGLRAQGEAAYTQFGVRYFILPNSMYGSWQE